MTLSGGVVPASVLLAAGPPARAAQLDHPRPATMLAAKFSLPFALATALAHGGASVPAFRAPALADPAILALAARVEVREDPDMTARLPGLRPARLRVHVADGRVLRAEAPTSRGDTEDPYGPDEVRDKFLDLAGPVWGGGHAERLADRLDRIERADTIQPLVVLLAAPPIREGSPA